MIATIITLGLLLIIGAIGGFITFDHYAGNLLSAKEREEEAREDADEMRGVAKDTLDREETLRTQIEAANGEIARQSNRVVAEANLHVATRDSLERLRHDYNQQAISTAQAKRDIGIAAERFCAAHDAHERQAEAYDVDIRQMMDRRDMALAEAARNNKGQQEQYERAEKAEESAEVLKAKLFKIQQVLTAPPKKPNPWAKGAKRPDGF